MSIATFQTRGGDQHVTGIESPPFAILHHIERATLDERDDHFFRQFGFRIFMRTAFGMVKSFDNDGLAVEDGVYTVHETSNLHRCIKAISPSNQVRQASRWKLVVLFRRYFDIG